MKTTPWTIDRSINLPFLGTVFAAVISGAVWASMISSRMDRVESQVDAIPESQLRVARMDERGASNRETLARMERQLERLEEARYGADSRSSGE